MSPAFRSKKSRLAVNDEGVQFPVTPMLDMAFQLLAFFVLTFQSPSSETHIDLDLPATPLALPGETKGSARPFPARRVDTDLENDLFVRAESNDLGDLKSLRLGELPVPDIATLGDRLQRYVKVLEGRPLRVRLAADDALRYEEATRLVAVISAAGVATIRLTNPSSVAETGPAAASKQP